MLKSNQSLAILLFARTAEKQSAAKLLSHDTDSNFQIHSAFHERAFDIASESGFPVFHHDETLQFGNTFGERLSNSIASVFNQGYEKVIVLGDDCPNLSVGDVDQASSLLEENQMVLGPDERGGAFLIGLSQSAFDWEEISRLPWQSNQLLTSFEKLVIASNQSLALISTKFDINTEEDLILHVDDSFFLRKLLRLISLHSQSFPYFCIALYILHLIDLSSRRRGPPLRR
ncbi:MAG: DUF2064 domain-containing protein [Cyclobacteriaceae bacterium]